MVDNWVIKGRTWVFGDDINTDYMMPGFTPSGATWEERAKYCMRANRPGWSEQVQKGDILVAGRNFGTGSNRPAARVLKVLGIACVVAEDINSLMFRNCVNWGLPAMACKGVSKLFVEGDIAEVNLREGTVLNTRTGEKLQAPKIPEMLLNIMAAGGVIPLLEKEGYIRSSKDELPKSVIAEVGE
ncbi:MAG: 3-isopropylmalate dehydratase [Candidatus Bathyarchaeia archaeon]